MRKTKKFTAVLLAVIMALSAFTVAPLSVTAVIISGTSGDYGYYLHADGTAEITIYTGEATELEIPSELDEYKVTSIGDRAFVNCTSLTSIAIPDSVTSINGQAFGSCTSLTSITIPDSVTSIGDFAFNNCTSLTNIIIPDSVASIGDYAFRNCTSLASITIPDSVTSIGDFAFSGCTSLKSVTIGNGVKSIGDDAFNDCENLISITAKSGNENYSTIDGILFNKDKTEIITYPIGKINESYIIPDSVTSIKELAFYKCTKLGSITIPDSVTNISDRAFYKCDSLTSITVASGNSNFCSLDGVLFSKDKTSLIVYPAGKTSESYTIPDGVTSIGDKAFEECTILKSVTIPNSIISIGKLSFCSCIHLTSLIIPDSVKEIGKSAFAYCSGLKSITLPQGLTSISDYMLTDCSKLEEVIIPDSVTSIGEAAFWHCSNLKSITFPYSVMNIGDGAFLRCYNLTSITISDKNENLDLLNNAISGTDSQITKLVISEGSKTITQAMVLFKNTLKEVTIPGTVTDIEDKAFSDCKMLAEMELPDGVKYIGESGFKDCSNLEKIIIPESVTEIGDLAFDGCPNLTIYGYKGSYAEIYANDNNINFISLNNEKFISECEITIGTTSYTYDGTAKKPSVTVKDGSTTLTNGTDYTVSYSNNTNAGTATVAVTGKGNYTGTATKNFTISAKSISTATVTLGTTSYTYDGTAKKPSVTVKDGSTTLTNGTDYTVAYSNNTNVGTATVTVTGKGNYTGSATKTFTITQAKSEFVWGEDNWSFDNSSRYFANYNVNSYVMNLMKEDFGLSNADIYELQQNIEDDNSYGFNGSCFGMTVSEILSKQGDLKLSRYGGNDTVNYNSNTSNMTSVINFIQELQTNSKFCQSIRQAPFLSGGYSQYDFIDKLESVLENEDNLVKISYAINSINRNTNKYSTNGYHAVLGYGVENCDYYSDITGKSYDKRILIADPNYLSQNYVYDEACLYYRSSDHSWIVPYWNKRYSVSTQLCYWNSGSTASTNTGYIRNIMKYNSLTEVVDLMTDYQVGHYVAGLEVDNLSQNTTLVEQIANSGNPNYDYSGESGSGIARYDVEMDDSFTINENDEFYALWNPTASYSMSYETPSKYNLKMDYKDIAYYANLTNSTYTSFKPNGSINAVGSNASYDLTIVTDESACVTDWFAVGVSGKDVDNVTYSKVDDGYVLSASNLDNVTVTANGDNSEANITFSTDYDSVYIYEIDANTIGLRVDTDNNGTYETELDTTPDYKFGDVNLDGNVNVKDATLIQRMVVEEAGLTVTDVQRALADINGDGTISVKDATALQIIIVNS